jgi:hypothetical protein
MTLYTVFMYLKRMTYNSHEPLSSRMWVISHIFLRESNEKISRNILSVSWIPTPSIFLECRPRTQVIITIAQFISLQLIKAQAK